MCADRLAYYYDAGDYAVVHLDVLRRWVDFLGSRYTRAELASASGISRTTIWRFEKGNRISPQSAYFLALGCLGLVKQYSPTSMGLSDKFGILMEVQPTLFAIDGP